MAVMTFGKINVNDLDERLIESIRSLFKDKTVEISVVIKEEDKKSLIGLDEILEKSHQSPYIVRFESDFDFAELADQIEKDGNFDLISVLEKRKIPNPYVIAP